MDLKLSPAQGFFSFFQAYLNPMTSKKLLVITGNQLTHKYFLNQLGSQFEFSAVIIENVQYPDPPFNSDEERKTWDEFFLIF